jgi:hypothetical protein
VRSRSNRTAGAPCCVPRPDPPSIRSAAPLASPCRPSLRNCQAQKPPPDYPNLWCLNRSDVAIALLLLAIFLSGGKVGSEFPLTRTFYVRHFLQMIKISTPGCAAQTTRSVTHNKTPNLAMRAACSIRRCQHAQRLAGNCYSIVTTRQTCTLKRFCLDLRSMDTRSESVSSFNALRGTGFRRVSRP